jgi:type IV pilus assembly protein PilQ
MHARWAIRRWTRRHFWAALVLMICALWSPGHCAAQSQQAEQLPVLTVPTGVPPAPANAATTSTGIDDAIAAALQAAGVAAPVGAGTEGAPMLPTAPEALPRPNPFVSTGTAAATAAPSAESTGEGQPSLLLPMPGMQASDNLAVNDNDNGLVSLMVREGSLRQVIGMIAQTQKLNIVFAGSTDVMVTAAFERQPWQKVLDALLSASGHVWTTRDDVIFVSSVDTADFLPPDAGGLHVDVFELDFASAIDLDQAIKGMLSPAGKSWVNESLPTDNRRTKESVAVVDYPAHIARIRDYICQADQPPRQVYIKAHILQIELTDDCRNGINFQNVISLSSADVTLRSVGFANTAPTSAFVVDANGVGLDGLIELLQNTTDAKTLASPEINAINGQTSRLQIGEKLPYRVTTTTQTATVESVQMLDVGVVLEVTPRVTRDGRVLMRIKPKVSTGAISADTGLPSEKTSEVETDVMMESGQGMVLGGLIQEEDRNVQSKLPVLGDIPYLGLLFQKRQVIKSRKEIIVTLRPFVLPYSPILQTEHDGMISRTEQPLTQGAIYRYPRPYEPRLPDTFDHYHKKHPVVAMVPSDMPIEPSWEPYDPTLVELPSVTDVWDSQVEDGVELLPEPAVEAESQ